MLQHKHKPDELVRDGEADSDVCKVVGEELVKQLAAENSDLVTSISHLEAKQRKRCDIWDWTVPLDVSPPANQVQFGPNALAGPCCSPHSLTSWDLTLDPSRLTKPQPVPRRSM
jgi:hypothetical protein